MVNLCGPCANGDHSGPGHGGICECDCHDSLPEAHRRVNEELVLIAAPEADRVRELLNSAVHASDAEVVRREGHLWSGRIGLSILHLADCIDAALKK